MISRTYSALAQGLRATLVEIEVRMVSGLPTFQIIGLASKAVEEARERISAAISACGVQLKARRTVVNLAPADLHKQDSSLELAIALALLDLHTVARAQTEPTLYFGELSLDGSVKPVRALLPLVLSAAQLGFSNVVVPSSQVALAQVAQIKITGISHLSELMTNVDRPENSRSLPTLTSISSQDRSVQLGAMMKHAALDQQHTTSTQLNLDDLVGMEFAKRGAIIAAAGKHNLLLTGPPGSGKTALAQCLASLLPELDQPDVITATSLHSLIGETESLVHQAPFRSPHHTISYSRLIGGGLRLLPGEISLAHAGVLFLDEFPEFDRRCIESLRQPLEEGRVLLARATGSVEYPCQFVLVAAANPCPCGYLGSRLKHCVCSPSMIERYRSKLSGPILDRIDLHAPVEAARIAELHQLKPSRSRTSEHQQSKRLIAKVRIIQKERMNRVKSAIVNPATLTKLFSFSSESTSFAVNASSKLQLSARAHTKLLKVARTIADLENSATVESCHVAEATQFRTAKIGIEISSNIQ